MVVLHVNSILVRIKAKCTSQCRFFCCCLAWDECRSMRGTSSTIRRKVVDLNVSYLVCRSIHYVPQFLSVKYHCPWPILRSSDCFLKISGFSHVNLSLIISNRINILGIYRFLTTWFIWPQLHFLNQLLRLKLHLYMLMSVSRTL